MNDRDEIADQREKHAQLSWYESRDFRQDLNGRIEWERLGSLQEN